MVWEEPRLNGPPREVYQEHHKAPTPYKPINRMTPGVFDRATPRAKRGMAKIARARVGFKKIGIEITTRKPNTRLVLPHGQLAKESFLRTTLSNAGIHASNSSKITRRKPQGNRTQCEQAEYRRWTKIISSNPLARGGPKKACQPADLRSLAVLACTAGFTRCSCSRQTSTSYLCTSRRSNSFWVFKLPRFHEKKRMLRGPGLDASPRRHSWVQAIHATTAWTPYLQSLHKRFWRAAGFLRTLANLRDVALLPPRAHWRIPRPAFDCVQMFTTGIYSHFTQQQVKQFSREAQNYRTPFDLVVERSFQQCQLKSKPESKVRSNLAGTSIQAAEPSTEKKPVHQLA